MYNVSQAYIDETNAHVMRECYAEFLLSNTVSQIQSSMMTPSGDYWDKVKPKDVTQTTKYPETVYATCERNQMKADGEAVCFDENEQKTDNYISNVISSAVPNGSGTYDLPSNQLSYSLYNVYTEFPPYTTILCHETVREITIIVSYQNHPGFPGLTWEQTYTSEDGEFLISDIPYHSFRFYGFSIKINKLSKPYFRGRINRIYFGEVEIFEASDIEQIDYKDVNDVVGNELPNKTVTVLVKNADKVRPEEIYSNSFYKRLKTQGDLTIVQKTYGGSEKIPTGRWFLDSFTADDEYITFALFDSISLLNEFEYQDSGFRDTVSVAFGSLHNQIMNDYDIHLVDYTETGRPQTTNLQLSTSVPLASVAQGAQLIGNYSGNYVFADRLTGWLSLRDSSTERNAIRTLSERLSYSRSVKNKQLVGSIVVNSHTATSKTKEVILATFENNEVVPQGTSYTTPENIINAQFKNQSPPFTIFTAFPHNVWLGATLTASSADVELVATCRDITQEAVTKTYAQSDEKEPFEIDNPLVNKSQSVAYADRIYSFEKNTVDNILEHRGFPELDAGDMIEIITLSDSRIKGIVTENTFNYSGTLLKGTTKVRRIDE